MNDTLYYFILLFIYTTGQKFQISKIFYVFKRSLFCSPRLQLFAKKNNKKNSNIVKYYYNLKQRISM